MKRYDERILGKLLDRYERSLLYSGKNQVNISISFPVQKKTLPEYFDEAAMQFDVIHLQLQQLEEQGYVRLWWKNKKKGHILEKCELVVERAEQAYLLLGRKPKNQKEQEILRICQSYEGKVRELDNFTAWVQERIHASESVRKYVDVDDKEGFERLCQLVFRILANDQECFLRQFSIRHFHDSKIAEKDMEKAAHVIAEFSEDERLSQLRGEEVLEEYNIYRNPSWLMMKGSGVFRKMVGEAATGREAQGVEIHLQAFPGGIGLSNQDMEGVCWSQEKRLETILTIENLTAFHQWNRPEGEAVLCIYLGGYHNRAKRSFLKKLYERYPDAEYFHFGDMDCGGFRIWKDLCVKTGIPFQTLHMDLQTYGRYLKYGRRMTEQDKKMLQGMMEDPFFAGQKELFERMLEEGVKLEQECVGDV